VRIAGNLPRIVEEVAGISQDREGPRARDGAGEKPSSSVVECLLGRERGFGSLLQFRK
jgi:hypothetical protein